MNFTFLGGLIPALVIVAVVISSLLFGVIGITLDKIQKRDSDRNLYSGIGYEIGYEKTIHGFKYKKVRDKFYKVTHGKKNIFIMDSSTKLIAIIAFGIMVVVLSVMFCTIFIY